MLSWCAALSIAELPDAAAGANQPAAPSARVYRYTMKGRVKLLFFWVGKDRVGGGTISFLSRPAGEQDCALEGVEVLFGSDPKRVPGGINRWGYAQEWSCWKQENGARQLDFTRFEGFMRHSKEESLAQVRSSDRNEKSNQLFWYDGIRSTVSAEEARSEIHVFAQKQDFDFRKSQVAWRAYQQRRSSGPPDREQSLRNAGLYRQPFGFLTGVQEICRRISQQFRSQPGNWTQSRFQLPYAYHAKAYLLETTGIRYHPVFDLEPAGGDPHSNGSRPRRYRDVAEVEFRLSERTSRRPHSFSVWYALEGPEAGVPLKIVDRPRWWLQVELNLEATSGSESHLSSLSGIDREAGN
ncbi:MAG: hypothetical protein AB1898_06600 [Acidobacteriota bacterium]